MLVLLRTLWTLCLLVWQTASFLPSTTGRLYSRAHSGRRPWRRTAVVPDSSSTSSSASSSTSAAASSLASSSAPSSHLLGCLSRREVACTATLVAGLLGRRERAAARGLIRFPLSAPLSNRYWLVRAGEGEYEAKDLVRSAPVGKTDMDNGLTQRGQQQAREAAEELLEYGVTSPTMWFSIWSRATQTALVIQEVLQISGERRLPEFTLLDARGLGQFEGTRLSEARQKVEELDARCGGNERLPIGEDGTTGESLKDLSVRVLQQVSIVETLANSIDVVIVAPDSDLLSVWQAVIAGAPLEGHTAFAMQPGEVRMLEYEIESSGGSPSALVLAPPKTAATAADGGGGGRFGSSELPARMAAAKALAAGAKAKYGGGFGAASEAEKRELVAALREKRERLEQEVMEDGAAERAAEAKRRADVAAKAAEARAARDRETLAAQAAKREAIAEAESRKKAAAAEAEARRRGAAAEEAERKRSQAARLSTERAEATAAAAAKEAAKRRQKDAARDAAGLGAIGGLGEVDDAASSLVYAFGGPAAGAAVAAMGAWGLSTALAEPEGLEERNDAGELVKGGAGSARSVGSGGGGSAAKAEAKAAEEEAARVRAAKEAEAAAAAEAARARAAAEAAAAAAAAAAAEAAAKKVAEEEAAEAVEAAEAARGPSLEERVQRQLLDAIAAVQADSERRGGGGSGGGKVASARKAADALSAIGARRLAAAVENAPLRASSSSSSRSNSTSTTLPANGTDSDSAAAAEVFFDDVFEDIDTYEESWLSAITEDIAGEAAEEWK